MQKLTAIILTFVLSACSFPGVYKINVQQGNIVTNEELSVLTEGMSRSQVHAIMGTPLVQNPVDPNRDYYIYTFQTAGGEIKEQKIVVHYYDDNYVNYEAQLLEETPAY